MDGASKLAAVIAAGSNGNRLSHIFHPVLLGNTDTLGFLWNRRGGEICCLRYPQGGGSGVDNLRWSGSVGDLSASASWSSFTDGHTVSDSSLHHGH
jgi:hypothetical protein